MRMKLTKRLTFWILFLNVCIVLSSVHAKKDVVKRLWKTWVGAEIKKFETRGLNEIWNDDVADNGSQLQDNDEVNFGQEELQVDFNSPEYRQLVLQPDIESVDVYADTQ